LTSFVPLRNINSSSDSSYVVQSSPINCHLWSDEDRCIYENYKYHLCLLSPPTMANSFTLLADLKAGRCSTTTAVLLISKNAGGVGLNLTAASNNPWWTPAMEEEAIMRIHRIQHKRIVCAEDFSRGLGERNAEMVQRNHMEQPTAVCVLKAGLHSVMRMTDFKNAMPHSYSMLTYLATFPCGAVPFTAEEERPPDLTCDGAAKKSEYVHVRRPSNRNKVAVSGWIVKKKTASDHSLMGSSVILFWVHDMS
ncbi:hypothetical protein HID58_041711, partial [Brassica napus]